jgi:hypothetical protein
MASLRFLRSQAGCYQLADIEMAMDVYEIDPLVDARWLDLQQGHPEASIFHTRGWLEALRRTYGYRPVAFTTSRPGSELRNGLPFCHINTWLTGRRLVSLPFSDHCDPLVSNREELGQVLDYIQRKSEQQHIEIRVRESGTSILPGFNQNKTFHFHTLDLSPGLDELFGRFHKNCIQRKIKRAEREGLVYDEGRSESLLAKFYSLVLMTRRRQGLPPQPLSWFRNLIACLGDSLTIRVASKNGQSTAGILTLRHKRTLVYKYGCSDERYNHLGGTQFLLWKAIQEAKQDQMHELDLGRSDHETPGLITFKDRWGTSRSTLTYWTSAASQTETPRRKWTVLLAKRLLTFMPDRFLTTAGRLLYRHTG